LNSDPPHGLAIPAGANRSGFRIEERRMAERRVRSRARRPFEPAA
jgi:hypothetical protein